MVRGVIMVLSFLKKKKPGQPLTVILPISASQVARITGVSHWRWASRLGLLSALPLCWLFCCWYWV
jgi:hypothetical protein